MPHSVGDVIRMTGHLLEHNPTTGTPWRTVNGKQCYCFSGALYTSAKVLKVKEGEVICRAMSAAGMRGSFLESWEGPNVTDEDRLKIAKRMQQYVG